MRILCWMMTLVVLLSFASSGCQHEGLTRPTENPITPVQWTDPNTLQPNAIQHERLSAEQLRRIKKLQATFREVDPSPLEKWVDDFKRDQDPDREIRIYEGMADAYEAYCSHKNLSPQAKQDAFQVVLLRSGAPDSEVLSHLRLNELTIEDAKQILHYYKVPPAPILVSKGTGR